MRITDEEARLIRQTVHRRFGQGARVWLFGSRVDDRARGGDIDLLVEPPTELDEPFLASIGLETDLQLALGDQKIDIVLTEPGRPKTAIEKIALGSGVEL